jgi:hypothetical protein
MEKLEKRLVGSYLNLAQQISKVDLMAKKFQQIRLS